MSEPLREKARWELVTERLRNEAFDASDETKLCQLDSLLESVDDFEWRQALAADDARVWLLWAELRRKWQQLNAPG